VKEGALIETSSWTDLDHDLLTGSNIVLDKFKTHEIWFKTDPKLDLPTYEFFRMAEKGTYDLKELMDMGDIVAGKIDKDRYDNGRTTIFMAEGMVTWDIAWAYTVWQNALKIGAGTELKLWDSPCWF